jgi:hemerythrin-like domain-containing protein
LFQIKTGRARAASNIHQPETAMTSTSKSPGPRKSTLSRDGFEVLDACHRETLLMLRKLGGLVAGLEDGDADAAARATAAEVVSFFSTTAREHHEDEERHVFPKLLASGDAEIVQAVLRLQQDHHWMDVDWRELAPLLGAVAAGQVGYDAGILRESVEIFTVLSYDHIALEESCVYPEARARLRAGELREMGREMAERHGARRKTGSRSAAGPAI